MAPLPSSIASRLALLPAALLLALFWWQAVSASKRWSHTSDELPHIASGYAYDKFGDFRMQPENGNLPQRVHGLAPLRLRAKFPDDQELWEHSQYWQLAWIFFYKSGNPLDPCVLGARQLNALFGVGLGLLIFLAARRSYGPAGGLLALGVYAFSPSFLFHSAQATSDLAGVLFLTLAAGVFWWHLERRSAVSLGLAGVTAGLALVAKFSGVLVGPIFAVLAVADGVLRRPAMISDGAGPRHGLKNPGDGRLAANLGHAAAAGLLAAGVIWAFYDFRFSARGGDMPAIANFFWPWPKEFELAGWKGALIGRALAWHLLPEAWLRGLDYVLGSEVERPAFLAGAYSNRGWWYFFPALFLAKTTLALLGGSLLALVLAARRFLRRSADGRRAVLTRWAPLATVALVTWAAALHSTLNIGHRHILAVYPVLFVAVGGLAALPRRWLVAPLILLAAQMTESLSIRPHYPAFFNALSGGPARAYRLAVDSSLDWGQSLPDLRAWLAKNRRQGEKLYLAYFGSAWPPHYGVSPQHFLPSYYLIRPPLKPYPFDPGLYCISATTFSEVYSSLHGPWTEEWEARYRHPGDDYEEFDQLRFARLCKYLRQRPPDGHAGYSILIFRLTAEELRAALAGPVR